MRKENCFRKFITTLHEKNEFRVEYNSFSDNDDDDNDIENLVHGVESDSDCSDEKETNVSIEKFLQVELKKVRELKKKFLHYCTQTPVLGFNSSKYDINLIKSKIFKHLEVAEKKDYTFTIKKQNAYLAISTPELRFLDISNYIAPGYSYSHFLKCYKVEEQKGFFCYQYLTSVEKLEETKLPPYEAFYSSLKGENVLEVEYNVWKKT